MREMRDSGVEWIGEIPKDWNCCKQKYRFTLINGRAFKDNEFEEDGTYRTYDEMVAEGKPVKYDGKWTAPCTAPDPMTGQGNPFPTYMYGVLVAEVEVDIPMCKVKLLDHL